MTKPSHLKVENTDLLRDTHSKAIISTDLNEYELYKKRRERELRLLNIEEKLDLILKLTGENALV